MSKSFNEKLINDVFEENKDKCSLSLNITVDFGKYRVGESCLGLEINEHGCYILQARPAKKAKNEKLLGVLMSRTYTPERLDELLHTETGIKIRDFVKQEVMKRLESM